MALVAAIAVATFLILRQRANPSDRSATETGADEQRAPLVRRASPAQLPPEERIFAWSFALRTSGSINPAVLQAVALGNPVPKVPPQDIESVVGGTLELKLAEEQPGRPRPAMLRLRNVSRTLNGLTEATQPRFGPALPLTFRDSVPELRPRDEWSGAFTADQLGVVQEVVDALLLPLAPQAIARDQGAPDMFERPRTNAEGLAERIRHTITETRAAKTRELLSIRVESERLGERSRPLSEGSTATLSVTFRRSKCSADFDRDWLRHASEDELHDGRAGQHRFQSTWRNLTITRLQAGDAAGWPESMDELRRALSTAREQLAASGANASTLAEVRARGLTEALDRFAAAAKGNWATASAELIAWLRSDPANPERVARWLDSGASKLGEDRDLALWSLIAKSGTPEAQAVLISALGGSGWSELSRFRAVAHLHDVPSPSEATVASLWAFYDANAGAVAPAERSLRPAALYALGSLGRAESVTPKVQQQITEHLRSSLARSASVEERLVALDAIGNSGETDLLPSVEQSLSSADPNERLAAMRALRHMGSDGLEAWKKRYLVEGEPSVRAKAAEALLEAAPSAARDAAARDALRGEAAPAALIPLVKALGSRVGADAQNETALRDLLGRNPPLEVRKAVYAYVRPAGG